MADTILTVKQIEDFFQNLTLQLLGLDPVAPASQSRARIDWPTKGAPGWKIDEDVSFLAVNYDDDPVTRQMEITYQDKDTFYADRTMSYTRVIRVSWLGYGPNSFNDIDVIRSGLFRPEFTQLLQASNLALITDVPMPVRSPELFNSQWWDRTNFYARFNEKVVRHSDVPYIQSGNVQIVKG
jgi:hypothetical protein